MLDVGFGSYNVVLAVGRLPANYNNIVACAALHEDFGIRGLDGESVFIAVSRTGQDRPRVALSLRHEYLDLSHFGVFIVEETDLLLIATWETLLAYDLTTARRL